MRVTLEYTAQLRRAAGCRSEVVELGDGGTLADALNEAAARHSPEFRQQLLTGNDEVQPSLLLFRGDAQIAAGANPSLVDGECVTIMSPISGG